MMQAITSPKTDTLSFLDQCTFVCLKYIVRCTTLDIQRDPPSAVEKLRELCKVAAQEAAEFGDDNELLPLVCSAYHLVGVMSRTAFDTLRLQECLKTLQSFLEQDVFGECAEVFVRPPVDSIEKVALLNHLIYKTSEAHGQAAIGAVVEIGVRYMRKEILEFINSQGGWKGIAALAQTQQQEDLSLSMVIVDTEEVKNLDNVITGSRNFKGQGFDLTRENQPQSPLSSPPFSIPSSVNTDDDRESLPTPPEIIERPMMTDTYIEAMNLEGGLGKPLQKIDDVENLDSDYMKEQLAKKPYITLTDSDESQSTCTTNVSTYEGYESTGTGKEALEQQTEEETPQESMFGGYLPHLSVGVAAAAAIASLFVLKRNT